MTPKRNKVVVIPTITNEEYAKNAFLKDSFIPGRWLNFQILEEEGFTVKGLIDHVGWTSFLQKSSALHYGPYTLFWGTTCQERVSIRGTVRGT